MRIIGGTLKGKRLLPVRTDGIRPTADRIRESIFNILGSLAEVECALDLFAGTGAMGIEALSRGAGRAVFVERRRQAADLVSRNLKSCGMNTRAEILRWDIAKNLRCLTSSRHMFDLVFMDPPYDRNLVASTLAHLHEAQCVQRGAWVAAEHSLSEDPTFDPQAWSLADRRRYGRTRISFFIHS